MKRIFLLINIISLTAMIYLGVSVLYRTIIAKLDVVHIEKTKAGPELSSIDRERTSISDYETITERNLFNTKTETEEKSKEIDIETLKKTDLNLELLGTITGDKDKAYAVISKAKKRKQDLYRIGDSIDNALVKMILREKVVLIVDGSEEILEMKKPKSSHSKEKATASKKSRSTDRTITLRRSQVESSISDINNLMNQAKIEPYFEDGEPGGFKINNIKRQSIFNKMRLKNGDIIFGVDGQEIRTVDDAMSLYSSMTQASEMTLQIKRKGEEKSLHYNVK